MSEVYSDPKILFPLRKIICKITRQQQLDSMRVVDGENVGEDGGLLDERRVHSDRHSVDLDRAACFQLRCRIAGLKIANVSRKKNTFWTFNYVNVFLIYKSSFKKWNFRDFLWTFQIRPLLKNSRFSCARAWGIFQNPSNRVFGDVLEPPKTGLDLSNEFRLRLLPLARSECLHSSTQILRFHPHFWKASISKNSTKRRNSNGKSEISAKSFEWVEFEGRMTTKTKRTPRWMKIVLFIKARIFAHFYHFIGETVNFLIIFVFKIENLHLWRGWYQTGVIFISFLSRYSPILFFLNFYSNFFCLILSEYLW